ncbi:MAG: hypothetical protein HY753_02185 [Nitrospirae bacterium]|nr:hypothetical protein [Nitrospirota bacterium]
MITFDFTNMMSEAVGRNGVNTDDIDSLKEQLETIHSDIVKRRLPEMYFLDLPNQDTDDINAMADNIRNSSKYFLLLGIGGSALGQTRALLQEFYL